jgi:hypothetical protein
MKLNFGLIKCLKTAHGVMALMVLSIASVALFMHRLDSPSYAAVLGVVYSLFSYTHSKLKTSAVSNPPPMSPPPQ